MEDFDAIQVWRLIETLITELHLAELRQQDKSQFYINLGAAFASR